MKVLIRGGVCIAINRNGFENLVKEGGDVVIDHDSPIAGYNYDDNTNSFYKRNSIAELTEQAKVTLAAVLSADIESGGHTWQVRNSIDLQNIKDAIDEHNYTGLGADVTQSFRMADNTWQDLTVDKFEKVLSDYRLRKKELYEKYKVWTSGDMLEDFAI